MNNQYQFYTNLYISLGINPTAIIKPITLSPNGNICAI